MKREKDDTSDKKEGNKFDKIFQENMEALLPGLMKKFLNINVMHMVELPGNVQVTKERKPDNLFLFTIKPGEIHNFFLELTAKKMLS